MPRPVILPTAWEDIEGMAERCMKSVGPRAAKGVTDAILDAIDLFENMPYLGPVHDDPLLQRFGFRKLLVKRYVWVYRIVEGVPTVYDVFYQSQDYAARLAAEN